MIPIRDEIEIFKGPTLHGRPSWRLYDPVNDKYIQLSQKDMCILSNSDLPENEIIYLADQDYKIEVTEDDIRSLEEFLKKAGLTIGFAPDDTQLKALKSQSMGWLKWLIHHYLFIRFKIGNPDKSLSRLYSFIGGLFNPITGIFLAILALIDAISVWSQWADYSENFKDFLTPSGIVMGMIAVGLSKVVHEFGHGLASKHYGIKVPSCGFAFLVLAPVLWTDTTQAWRLKSNFQRVIIDCAGMIAEITLAIFATLLWCLVDDSPFRHFLFILSSTTWVIAVVVNVSPLMRFDGYRILSDLLGIPNLMERAFTYSKWRLRKTCLGLPIEEPDDFSDKQKIAVLIYSPATWIYRFGLFTGIALMVYHATFHALGIILMGIEIGTFVIGPIIRELLTWIKLLKDYGMTKRAYTTFSIIGLGLVFCILPVGTHQTVQAMLTPAKSFEIMLPSGKLSSLAQNGQEIKKGSLIGNVDSADIDGKLTLSEDTLKTETADLQSLENDTHNTENEQIAKMIHEIRKAHSDIEANQTKKNQMSIYAPFDGIMVDRDDNLKLGQYVNERERLGYLVSKEHQIIAYVPETVIPYIHVGDKACYRVNYGLHSCEEVTISHIDYGSTKSLRDGEFSSPYHGTVKSHKTDKGDMVPDDAVYRVVLTGIESNELKQAGLVRFHVKHTTIAGNFFRKATSLVIREAGF